MTLHDERGIVSPWHPHDIPPQDEQPDEVQGIYLEDHPTDTWLNQLWLSTCQELGMVIHGYNLQPAFLTYDNYAHAYVTIPSIPTYVTAMKSVDRLKFNPCSTKAVEILCGSWRLGHGKKMVTHSEKWSDRVNKWWHIMTTSSEKMWTCGETIVNHC